MRLVMITAAALALSTSLAMAQMASPGGLGNGPGIPSGGVGGAGATSVPHAPAVNPLTTEDVSHIVGTAVYDSDGHSVGSISHVLMKTDSKTIDRLVVAEGGLLGLGAHNVALPIGQFKWDQQKDGFTIAKTADDLKSMAAWQDPWREAMAAPGSTTPQSH